MNCALDLAYHVGTQNDYSSVPAPTKEDPKTPWFYDWCASQMETWAHAGITDIVAPPPGKAQGGSGKGCDGYGTSNPFYDLGLTGDQGSIETRFGPFRSLLRMVARAHRFGMRVHFAVVLHQRDGGKNQVYNFSPAGIGRWPLNKDCFTPPRPGEPIMGDAASNYAFGDPCSYVNALDPQYMLGGVTDAIDWMGTTIDADGYWADDPKGLAQKTLNAAVNYKSMASKFVFAEFYDGNPQTLNWFVWNQMGGRVSTMDFTLRWHVQAACNNASRYDMRQLLSGGFNLMSPMNAVTFCEDHDTDLSFPLIWNKAMAYFILMMMPGLPMPFGRDYFSLPNCYGLAHIINNQIWCRQFLAQGEYVARYGSYQIIAWELMGYGDAPGCVCIVNNEMGSLSNPTDWKRVRVQTHFINARLKDYSSNGANDVYTDGQGWGEFWVPGNDQGMGYVCHAPHGYSQPIKIGPALTTTHRIEGAPDLGIGPAKAGAQRVILDIYVEAQHPITVKQLHGPTLRFFVTGPIYEDHGVILATENGWCQVSVGNDGTTDANFVVEITYMGSSTMPESELTPTTFAINAEPSENDIKRMQHRAAKLAATRVS